jgi:cytochrome c-L
MRLFAFVIFAAFLALSSPSQAQDSAPGSTELLQDIPADCTESLPFTHVLTGDPLPLFRPDEEITPAVKSFHCTGENPYNGDETKIAQGKKLFALCAGCHLPDGTGRMGPNIVDDAHKYDRVATEHGEFEVIYGGAAGAMQAFGKRFDQDEILKIMAYVNTLAAK